MERMNDIAGRIFNAAKSGGLQKQKDAMIIDEVRGAERNMIFIVSARQLPLFEAAIEATGRDDVTVATMERQGERDGRGELAREIY